MAAILAEIQFMDSPLPASLANCILARTFMAAFADDDELGANPIEHILKNLSVKRGGDGNLAPQTIGV